MICDGMERLNGLRELCLEGTNELLLEMPFYRWPESIWDTLYRLNDLHEIRIVIAHADRYPPEAIHQLISEGIPLQLNAECLRKYSHRKRYLGWIQKGMFLISAVIFMNLGRATMTLINAGSCYAITFKNVIRI